MKVLLGFALLPLLCAQPTPRPGQAAVAAAKKFLPDVSWRADSVVAGNFTCRGRKEWALLGNKAAEIVVAVFVDGLARAPQVLLYSATARDASAAKLFSEPLDLDPEKDLGYALPGFRRSKSCFGLRLSDDSPDGAHIYWNHVARRFEDWSL